MPRSSRAPRGGRAPRLCTKSLTSLQGAAQIPANTIQEAAPQLQLPDEGLAVLGTDPGHQHHCLGGKETFSQEIWEAWEHPQTLSPPRSVLGMLTAWQKAPASPAHPCAQLMCCSATSEWCHGPSTSAPVHTGVGSQAGPQ